MAANSLELRQAKNARQRERYKNDSVYREHKLAGWRRSYHRTIKFHTDAARKHRHAEYYKQWRMVPANKALINGWIAAYRDRRKLRMLVRRAIIRAKKNNIPCDAVFLLETFAET